MLLWLIVIQLFVGVFILWHNYYKNGFDITQPIYYYLIAYIGLYSLQAWGLIDIASNFYREEILIKSLLLAIVGLLFFYLGYASPLSLNIARSIPTPTPTPLTEQRLINLGLFWILIGIIGQVVFIERSGGIEVYFSVARGFGAYKENTAYLYLLKWVIFPGLVIGFVAIASGYVAQWKKIILYLTGIGFWLFQVIAAQRSGVIMVGILLLACYYLPKKRKIPVWNTLFVFLAVFYITGLICLFRGEMFWGSSFEGFKTYYSNPLEKQFDDLSKGYVGAGGNKYAPTREFLMYNNFINIIPDKVEYAYGRLYADYLVNWIPLIIWPNRTSLFQEYKAQLYYGIPFSTRGAVFTILGEYYLNLGIPGIILGCYVTGLLLGILFQWKFLHPNNPGVLIVFLSFFQIGGMWVICQGVLGNLDRVLPFTAIPVVSALLLMRKSKIYRPKYAPAYRIQTQVKKR
jgi:oligosaccharide repeat unit polymerase